MGAIGNAISKIAVIVLPALLCFGFPVFAEAQEENEGRGKYFYGVVLQPSTNSDKLILKAKAGSYMISGHGVGPEMQSLTGERVFVLGKILKTDSEKPLLDVFEFGIDEEAPKAPPKGDDITAPMHIESSPSVESTKKMKDLENTE